MRLWIAASLLAAAIDAAGDTIALALPQNGFRSATHVVSATALDDDHLFAVDKIWKGDPGPAFRITWPRTNSGGCLVHSPTEAGHSYLVAIACDERHIEGQTVVFRCAAWEEPVELSGLKRFVENRRPLDTGDVTRMMQSWLAGRLSSDRFAQWIAEALATGDVTDWIDFEKYEFSPTLGVLYQLDLMLDDGADCDFDHVRQIAPAIFEFLAQPSVDAAKELDETLWEDYGC